MNEDDQLQKTRRSKRTAVAVAKIKIRDKTEDSPYLLRIVELENLLLFVANRGSLSETNGTFKNFQGQSPLQNGLIINI